MANLTPEGLRAARGLLTWSVRDLSDRTSISANSISAYENGRPMRASNRAKITAVIEAAGIEILNGDAPGARMKPTRADLHDEFGAIVDAISASQPAPDGWAATLSDIEQSARVSAEQLPSALARAIADLDDGDQLATYGDAVGRLRALLSK